MLIFDASQQCCNGGDASENSDLPACDSVGLIGQGFGVGMACPDNSVTFDALLCDLIAAAVAGEVGSCLA